MVLIVRVAKSRGFQRAKSATIDGWTTTLKASKNSGSAFGNYGRRRDSLRKILPLMRVLTAATWAPSNAARGTSLFSFYVRFPPLWIATPLSSPRASHCVHDYHANIMSLEIICMLGDRRKPPCLLAFLPGNEAFPRIGINL